MAKVTYQPAGFTSRYFRDKSRKYLNQDMTIMVKWSSLKEQIALVDYAVRNLTPRHYSWESGK